jgi:hypothetical protein
MGRGRLAVFPRCSLGPSRSTFCIPDILGLQGSMKVGRDGRFARALKNRQLTCGETKGI